MAVRVDITRLYALADNLVNLQNSIRTLSDNAVGASGNVLQRVAGNGYVPLASVRNKAMKTTELAKDLYGNVCGNLTRQAEILRNGAASYREKDSISKVN